MEVEKKMTKEVEVVLKTTFNAEESEVRLASNIFSGNKRLISILIDDEISEYFSSEEEYLIELGNFASKVRFSGIVPEEAHELDIISEIEKSDASSSESTSDTKERVTDVEDLDSLIDEGFLSVEEMSTDFVSEDKEKKNKKSKKDKKKKKKKSKSEKKSDTSEQDTEFSHLPKGTPISFPEEEEEEGSVESNDFFKNMEEFENELTGGYEARVDLPEPTLEYVKKLKDEQGSDALKEYLAKLTQTQKESLAALVAASKKK